MMTLRLKANLIFVLTAVIGLLLGVVMVEHATYRARVAAATSQAALMTAQADATARYTQHEVAPLVAAGDRAGILFVPQAAPFYAVEAHARLLTQALPAYSLRRVVIDPTSADDRPNDWERAAIMRVRDDPEHDPFVEEHDGAAGRQLVMVTPLRMEAGACATCYTSRAQAPTGVLDAFGASQGFNRKPGEVIGATIASVPLAAGTGFGGSTAVIWLIVMAFVLWGALNLILEYVILRPLGQVAAIADQISLGASEVAEFETADAGELGALTRSFNRLRRSMESAMTLMDS